MVSAKQGGSVKILKEMSQTLRWRRTSIIALIVHVSIVILILFIAPMSREFFAYRFEGTDIPLMAIWMIAMLISLIVGMLYGIKAYRAKVRDFFFMFIFVLGCLSSSFWGLFLAAEVLFSH